MSSQPVALRAVAGNSQPGSSRNLAVDFFRGLGLLCLLLDHFEPNVWSRFTPAHFGFSDFAEIFIFLSGYMSAGMYRRAVEKGGFALALRKLRIRLVRLYLAHIASMFAGLALLGFFAARGLRLNEPGLYLWMDAPAVYALRALALLYAPHWFNLLRLYVVLAPLILLGVIALRRWPLPTLAVSCALWVLAQSYTFQLPLAITGPAVWYFHPLAWQFLFVLGAATEIYWERLSLLAASPISQALAAPVVLVSFLLKAATQIGRIRFRIFATMPPEFIPLFDPDAGKATLAPLRLIHFLALVLLVTAIPWQSGKLFESWPGRVAIGVGRDSLFIFCATLLVTAAGNLLLQYYNGGRLLQFVCSALGLAIMASIAYARGKVPSA